MKKILTLAGIATLVALVGLTAVSAIAFAQDGDDGADWPFNMRERIHEAVSKILGITGDEYGVAVDQAREQVLQEAVEEGLLTQDQADRMQERMADGYGPGMMGQGRGGLGGPRSGGFGMMSGRGSMMNGSQISPFDVAAEVLGMPVDDLLTELQAGKTIADVAEAKGVDPQAIADAFVSRHSEWLTEAVADGRITQAQADAMQERAESMIDAMLDQGMPFGGRGGGRGGSGFGGRGFGGPGFGGSCPMIDSDTQNDA